MTSYPQPALDPSFSSSQPGAVGQKKSSIMVPTAVSALSLLKQQQREASQSPLYLLPHRREPQQPQQQHPGGGSKTTTTPCGGVFPLCRGITEIAGQAGAGKTQIALGLCVSCAAAADAASNHGRRHALYVSLGEGSPQAKIAQRLHQMVEHRRRRRHCHCFQCCDFNNDKNENTTNDNSRSDIMDRIWTRSLRNEEELLQLVRHELPEKWLSSTTRIGIVVLDSLAAMFRVSEEEEHSSNTNNNDDKQYARRSARLFEIAAQLKKLSDLHDLPIVVLNQASTTWTDYCSTTSSSSSSFAKDIPALGLSWASCVNTAYWVSRQEEESITTSTSTTTTSHGRTTFRRQVTLRRSSQFASTTAAFAIDAGGAVAILDCESRESDGATRSVR